MSSETGGAPQRGRVVRGEFNKDPDVVTEEKAKAAAEELKKSEGINALANSGIVTKRLGKNAVAATLSSKSDVTDAVNTGSSTDINNSDTHTSEVQESSSLENEASRLAETARQSVVTDNPTLTHGAVVQNANPHIAVNPQINITVPEQKSGLSTEEILKIFREMLDSNLSPLKPGYVAATEAENKLSCAAPVATHSTDHMPMPNATDSSTSGASVQKNAEWDKLAHIYKEIRKHPEAQLQGHDSESQKLSDLSTTHAKNLSPLETVPGFQKIMEKDRLVLKFTPVKEGPIFVARMSADNQPVMKNGELVYDILYFNADKTLNPKKSFISPDNVPAGTRSGIEENLRRQCFEYHAGQNQQKEREKALGWPPEERDPVKSQAHSVAANAKNHVVEQNNSQFTPGVENILSQKGATISKSVIPPPPPLPPPPMPQTPLVNPKSAATAIGTDLQKSVSPGASKSFKEELKQRVEKRNNQRQKQGLGGNT